MNLKVGFLLLLYYSLVGIFFAVADSPLSDAGYSSNVLLNETDVSLSEEDTGGLFSTGVSFSRFFMFVLFGVGLPEDTPTFFSVIFIAWQTIITILAVMFVISSIWNG